MRIQVPQPRVEHELLYALEGRHRCCTWQVSPPSLLEQTARERERRSGDQGEPVPMRRRKPVQGMIGIRVPAGVLLEPVPERNDDRITVLLVRSWRERGHHPVTKRRHSRLLDMVQGLDKGGSENGSLDVFRKAFQQDAAEELRCNRDAGGTGRHGKNLLSRSKTVISCMHGFAGWYSGARLPVKEIALEIFLGTGFIHLEG